jgi:hypothetical protein
MKDLVAALVLATTGSPTVDPGNWCRVGQTVMIPDGREGPVTSLDGEICRVLVYGEKYVSLWPSYMIEPIYPSVEGPRAFGH